jgi:UDP-N-acetylmuramoyl-tripeptide--D-alanyl-D-alanine ligase
MQIYSSDEIANLTHGKVLYWDSKKIIETFSQYPNSPLPNSLYLIKERITNEEKLISKLRLHKCSGIITSKSYPLNLEKFSSSGIGVIVVNNIYKAYFDIVRFHRKQFNIPFVQVIGSSGKSTTKEMIGSVLKSKFNTFVSYKNLNSELGVAFNIYRLKHTHQAAVLETGMRSKGVIATSTSIIRPDFVIVTCIHRAHLVTLGSIEKIIAAKSEFINYLSPESTVIINGDDENCKKLPLHRHKGKVLTFGLSESCDIYAKDIQCKDFKMHFKACTRDIEFDCTINTIGMYNVLNSLSTILLGLNLGLSPNEIQKGLSQFKPVDRRLQVTKGNKDSWIINDTFNANPDSTEALIGEVQSFSHGKPVILVLGDFENPNYQDSVYPKKVHYEVGKKAAEAGLYKLIAIGKWSDNVINGATDNGFPIGNTAHFAKAEDAIGFLEECIVKDSIILFKSSIHTNLTKLISRIKRK